MQLSKETIEEFRKLYKRKEGKELTDQEALEIATNLLLAFEAIYHPIPTEEKDMRQSNKPPGGLMHFISFNDTMHLKI